MPLEKVIATLREFKAMGAAAITITGGGEPTLHPDFSEILYRADSLRLQTGLVTNGALLDTVLVKSLRLLTWLRVSVSDDRNVEELLSVLSKVRKGIPAIKGWAFSYVLTAKPDYDKLALVVKYANYHKFTHVRIVSDLLDTENVPDMAVVRQELRSRIGIKDSLVIYQGRKDHTVGAKKCWISLLKPMIGTNGNIYPCCGIQYAMDPPSLDFEPRMQMNAPGKDWKEMFNKQIPFDGSHCTKCYYGDYNAALDMVMTPLEHEEFV
jgi:organic radical activating enzyme